ncbi:histidinol-phosphate transaminase [Streptomyces sp. JV176]|uniref:histidinol-phosphate transaminase n=1 Tax=Streptomyces sp. JV176 TaxID=858630 RepID=UPI002E7A5AD5|nr:histidinol-phosphate transaminase [Streptomyces sp. JV176]MEE1802287.1 histidinol-phosphate transaminase [Streptomyces sp. JV176]
MSLPRLRAVLGRLTAYQATEGVHTAAARTRPLSANESPHDPLPGIAEAIADAASTVNRYPDPGCGELTRAIARRHGITDDRVVVGAGSVALLQTLMQSVGDPGTEVVYAWRSFELYPVLADLAGLRSVRVPLVDGAHDLPAMADRVTDATRLVLLCNPNNPTGTVVTGEALRTFLARTPATCLVALDEAYYEYARDPAASSGLDLCAAHPNLVVLRTFSKAYGLAGLRVGYLVGHPRVTEQLRKACLAYAVNGVAQRGAVAALGVEDQLLRRVEATVAERGRVRDALAAHGWDVPAGHANFLWLRLGDASAEFGRWCTGKGIAVRTFPGEGVRVSIGCAEDNDVFLAASAAWLTRTPAGARAVSGAVESRAAQR